MLRVSLGEVCHSWNYYGMVGKHRADYGSPLLGSIADCTDWSSFPTVVGTVT